METVCVVNKPHSPFPKMEHPQCQFLATTVTKSHRYYDQVHQGQQHQQQPQQPQQQLRFSPSTSDMYTVPKTETVVPGDNNCPKDNTLNAIVDAKQTLQMSETNPLTMHTDVKNSPKRPWSETTSFTESSLEQDDDEYFSVSEKRLCQDFSRNFAYEPDQKRLDVKQSRFLMQTRDNGLDKDAGDDVMTSRTDSIVEDRNPPKEERSLSENCPVGETLEKSRSKNPIQHRTVEENQNHHHEDRVENKTDENSNFDSSPATPSSGFIDIESDTPPMSPLNLTTPTTHDTLAPESCNNKTSDGDVHNQHRENHRDSALGHEIEDHENNQLAPESQLKSSTATSINREESRCGQNSPRDDGGLKTGVATKETQHVTSPSKSPVTTSYHEASKTNFSIDAILSPRFGSATTTVPAAGSVSPRHSPNVEKSQLSPARSKLEVEGCKSTTNEEPTCNIPSMKPSPSAFTAVDLRTGTRSSSLSSPSPSSRSSVLSSPVSGSPSPPLSSFSVPLPIPAFYNKDLFTGSEFFAEKNKDHGFKSSSLQDPRQLLLSELYELHQSQSDPARGDKPTQKFESPRDLLHTLNREKTDFFYFPKFLPSPGRELETFLSRHLPFLSHPTLAHPAVLPFIYPPNPHYHHHHHHQQQQQQKHPHQQQQQKQNHPLLSPSSAQAPQMTAPPLLDPTRPHIDPLRLLQQAHPSFPQTPSASASHPTSPKGDTQAVLRNEHTHRIRNMAKSHADNKDRNPVTNMEKSHRNTADSKTTHAHVEKKDILAHSRVPPTIANPLHQIINQFDPEKLFSAKDGILSPSKVTAELSENNRSHRANQNLEKPSYKHELQKISTSNSKHSPDHSRNQNKPNCFATEKSVLPSPTRSNTKTEIDKHPQQENQKCAKSNNSSKTDAETEGKGEKGENPLWPAWVFCTRYSDRPSSGPRSRKPKRCKTQEEKRPRTAFTNEQLQRLKREFEDCRYLTETRRKSLADQLGLTESQIKIWFQNKRAKIKKSGGARNHLALQLMEQGLYNHSTVKVNEQLA